MGDTIEVFDILVAPKVKQRPRFAFITAGKGKNRRKIPKPYTPEETIKYQNEVARQVAFQLDDIDPIEEECVVFIYYFRKDNRRSDIDNYIKSSLDACNEVLYTDDYLIRMVFAESEKDPKTPRSIMGIMTYKEYKEDPMAAIAEWMQHVEDNRNRYKATLQ